MKRNITGSLAVCCAAAIFAGTALIVSSDDQATCVTAAPPAAVAPDGGPLAAVAAGTGTESTTLTIENFGFGDISVAPGASFTVANNDGVSHTVTATDGSFDSGTVAAGAQVQLRAPSQPGTYEFVCNIHPQMRGRLVVR